MKPEKLIIKITRISSSWWIRRVFGKNIAFFASSYEQLHAKYYSWKNSQGDYAHE